MFSPPRQRFVSFYALLVVGWLCLFIAGLGFVVGRSLKQVEKDFIGESEQSVATLRDRLRANEAVLAGFAVFLGANGNADRAATQRYAQAVLNHYPQIHLLEVAQRVGREERAGVEAQLGKRWLPGFAVRTFGALPGQAADKPEYFPLVLIAPDLPAAQETYGLDLDSVPHLRSAMRDAFSWRKPASSNPFPLAEGGDAYAVFQAVDQLRDEPSGESLVALLVVRSESLRPLGLGAQYEYAARIYRGEARADAPKLFAQTAAPAGGLESLVLPRYRIETAEFSASQPIHLEVGRQVRWADIQLDDVWRVSLLALCGLALLVYYIRQHRGAVEDARAMFDRAEYLALHDPLTQLPNRALITDRVAQAINRWRRRKTAFALFMIDLDRFKEINDRFRHEGGDRVLELVAQRLAAGLRVSDTVGRYGGDEFLVLLPDIQDDRSAIAIAEKLRNAVAEPIVFRGQQVRVTCSVGVAICPRDGDNDEALIRQAEQAMCRIKDNGRNGVSALIEKTT